MSKTKPSSDLKNQHKASNEIIEPANHVDIVLFNGNIESLATLFERVQNTTNPILVMWVSLPNYPDNENKRQKFETTKQFFQEQYPHRNIFFLDFMVKSEHGEPTEEDFDSISISVFGFHLYQRIKRATIYWSTSKEHWETVDQNRLSKMKEIAESIYSFKIHNPEVTRTERKQHINNKLLLTLGYEENK